MHSAGKRAEPSETLLEKKRKKIWKQNYMLSAIELIFFCVCVFTACSDHSAFWIKKSYWYQYAWSISRIFCFKFEIWSYFFDSFQRSKRIFHFSQCQSGSAKCYSFCKCKLKTIITWLTYLVVKMPGTTHLLIEWRSVAITFTRVGIFSALEALDMLFAQIKEGKKGEGYILL